MRALHFQAGKVLKNLGIGDWGVLAEDLLGGPVPCGQAVETSLGPMCGRGTRATPAKLLFRLKSDWHAYGPPTERFREIKTIVAKARCGGATG